MQTPGGLLRPHSRRNPDAVIEPSGKASTAALSRSGVFGPTCAKCKGIVFAVNDLSECYDHAAPQICRQALPNLPRTILAKSVPSRVVNGTCVWGFA